MQTSQSAHICPSNTHPLLLGIVDLALPSNEVVPTNKNFSVARNTFKFHLKVSSFVFSQRGEQHNQSKEFIIKFGCG
jgi:hypothetical protein